MFKPPIRSLKSKAEESGEDLPDVSQLPPHPKGTRQAIRKRKAADKPSAAAPPPKQSKGSKTTGDDVARGEQLATFATDPSNVPRITAPPMTAPTRGSAAVTATPDAPLLPSQDLAGNTSQDPSKESAGGPGSTGTRRLQLVPLRGRRAPKKSSVPSSSASLGDEDAPIAPAPETATATDEPVPASSVSQAPEPDVGSGATVLETPLPPEPSPTATRAEEEVDGASAGEPENPSAGAGSSKTPMGSKPQAPSTSGARTRASSRTKTAEKGIVVPIQKQKMYTSDLLDDPMLSQKTRNEVGRTFKELYEFTKNLMDRSAEKSECLKECEDGLTRLQEKDRQLSAEIQKRLDLRNELNTLKNDTTREIWLLKNDVQNLEKEKTELSAKNKEISKAHKDDVERLQKVIADTDVQYREALEKVKNLAEEKAAVQKELEDFKAAAQSVIELVEVPTDGGAEAGSVLEKLRTTPQKVANYISEATRAYITQALTLVKSYWPKASLGVLGDGMATNCSVEQFNQFCEEVEPIAKKIAESLEQDG